MASETERELLRRLESLERRVSELEQRKPFDPKENQIMPLKELAPLLGYEVPAALLAIRKGQFPIPTFKVARNAYEGRSMGREGWRDANTRSHPWVASVPVVKRYFEDKRLEQMRIYEEEFMVGVRRSGIED